MKLAPTFLSVPRFKHSLLKYSTLALLTGVTVLSPLLPLFNNTMNTAAFAATGSATLSRSVAAWLPWWSQAAGMDTVKAYPQVFDEISLFWYDLGAKGELIPQTNALDKTVIAALKAQGIAVIPTISNQYNGALVSSVLND
ncbi:MAG TPA: hypothetical protein VHS59_00530, partial [Bacillota bacterium]|nr:hypothetical protein [Bacillota bacterium]